MQKIYLFIWCLFTAGAHAADGFSPKLTLDPSLQERWVTNHPEPFSLFTVPKSGSHLIIKLIYFLTGYFPEWHMHYPIREVERTYLYTHLCLSPALQNSYAMYLPHRKKIVHIRDLRDVAVSIVHHILKTKEWPGLGEPHKWAAFKNASFDEQLLYVIEHDYEAVNETMVQFSLGRIAQQAVDYLDDPEVLVTRYESLVGPAGGGSLEMQVSELERIMIHLGGSIDAAFASLIANLLYGDGTDPFEGLGFRTYHSTFREGKIGQWRDVFKPEHKAAFKKRMGAALVALGYAADDEW